MNGFIQIEQAETDLLANAAYVAERIGSADGHSASVSDIALRYAAKGEVDLAAQLADTIQDPHVRDTTLAEIAARCVEFDDDEYGLQLSEAIEEYGFQQQALTMIAARQAERGKFDRALETAAQTADPSVSEAEVAIRLHHSGDELRARQILDQIDFPTVRVQVLNEFAANKIRNAESPVLILDESLMAVESVEYPEERTQLLLEIASRYLDAKHNERAFEVLEQARQLAETLDQRFSDQTLTQIALLYGRAGEFKRAEQSLKPITDSHQTALAQVGIALEHHSNGADEYAVSSLEEAFAILRAQRDREIRDSKARFNLMATIAVRFAQFGKFERALEVALDNAAEEPRFAALNQIAAVCAANGKNELAGQAINAIEDLAARAAALVSVSDAERKNDVEKSLQTLNEAYALSEEIAQLPTRSSVLNEIAVRFVELGEREKAIEVLRESLQIINRILDKSNQSIELAKLAETYENLKFEISDAERETMRLIVRRRS